MENQRPQHLRIRIRKATYMECNSKSDLLHLSDLVLNFQQVTLCPWHDCSGLKVANSFSGDWYTLEDMQIRGAIGHVWAFRHRYVLYIVWAKHYSQESLCLTSQKDGQRWKALSFVEIYRISSINITTGFASVDHPTLTADWMCSSLVSKTLPTSSYKISAMFIAGWCPTVCQAGWESTASLYLASPA